MDYEKKYKEALERARKFSEKPYLEDSKGIVDYIFPELKESEDIRKRIIDALHGDVLEMGEIKKAIAWLEKQGNLMKALQISNAKIGELIEKNYYLKEQLEKQGKNNMGISEATKQKLEDNLNKALEKETPDSWNKFLDEQKPEDKIESRQEELTEFEKAVKQVMEEAIECGDTHNLKADADMLLRLVQKSSWSEEDREMSRIIGNAITTDYASTYLESEGIQVIDAHVWLEELKERVQPHSTWNPSDEQMLAINTAINVVGKGTINGKYLIELQEQLKKLMDEDV